jgi:hypothetical protein
VSKRRENLCVCVCVCVCFAALLKERQSAWLYFLLKWDIFSYVMNRKANHTDITFWFVLGSPSAIFS